MILWEYFELFHVGLDNQIDVSLLLDQEVTDLIVSLDVLPSILVKSCNLSLIVQFFLLLAVFPRCNGRCLYELNQFGVTGQKSVLAWVKQFLERFA